MNKYNWNEEKAGKLGTLLMEAITTMQENTVNGEAPNIQGTDTIINTSFFQDYKVPSLQRALFPTITLEGPSGAFFNAVKDGESSFALKRQDVSVYDSKPIKTGITQEALQDMINMFGNNNAKKIVRGLFDSQVNTQVNARTLEFLDDNAEQVGALQMPPGASNNAEQTVFALIKKVYELVLEANTANQDSDENITRKSFCLIPYEYGAAFEYINIVKSISGESTDFQDHENGIIARSPSIDFALNPDPNENRVFVGLKDLESPSKSVAIYSPYAVQVREQVSPDTGDTNYHLFNRFAIGKNPLHTNNRPLLWSFEVVA